MWGVAERLSAILCSALNDEMSMVQGWHEQSNDAGRIANPPSVPMQVFIVVNNASAIFKQPALIQARQEACRVRSCAINHVGRVELLCHSIE